LSTHRQITDWLVIATHNPGKLREMAELLAPFGIETASAAELGLPEPQETGESFAENARIKATAAAKGRKLPAFADDSGLVVAALDGAPGIESARWAGPRKDFKRAMDLVEAKLRERNHGKAGNRHAHFISALCIAWPDGHVEEFEGRVDGTLVWPPRGTAGFGYDPMFAPAGGRHTFGELPRAAKQALSHRGRALRQLLAACLPPAPAQKPATSAVKRGGG
jgi:XTP/dITP diphosphohydrolase